MVATRHNVNLFAGPREKVALATSGAIKALMRQGGVAVARPTADEAIALERFKFLDTHPEFTAALATTCEFRNAQSALDGSGGGYTIPETFSTAFDFAMASRSLRRMATTERLERGGVHRVPYSNNSTTGIVIAEGDEIPDVAVEFSSLALRPKTYSSGKCLVPLGLHEDSDPAVYAPLLGGALGEVVARKQAIDFTSSLCVSAAQVTAGASTSIAVTDLESLIGAVGDSHFDSSDELVFMAGATAFKQIIALRDGNGAPVFVNGRLYGFRLLRNGGLSAPASGAYSVTFGRHQKFRIVDVREARILAYSESKYITAGQILWLAILRSEGGLVAVDAPVAALVH